MMKKTIFLLYLSVIAPISIIAQNTYTVNTSKTNINTKTTEKWIEPIRYNTLKAGMRFMVLPPVQSSSRYLDFKTKNDENLIAKDFGNEIFVYKKWQNATDKDGYDKRRYYFDCKGKEYFLEELKPNDENKIVDWDASSLIWLDEI